MSSKLTDQADLKISPQETVLLQNQESLQLIELYLKRSRFAVLHTILLYLFVAYSFYGAAETSHVVANTKARSTKAGIKCGTNDWRA